MSVDRWGLTFTYYPVSGGVVVTSHGIPLDAGFMRLPGETVTWVELSAWADEWYLRDGLNALRTAEIAAKKSSPNP